MKVFSAAQSVELEKRAIAGGMTYAGLMENAGVAAVRFLLRKFPVKNKKIVILCGKGNNGGDGFVMARRLAQMETRVAVVLAEGPPVAEPAIQMYQQLPETYIRIVQLDKEPEIVSALLYSADIIVDAIYGIGFHGRVKEELIPVFQQAEESFAPIVSIDMPSGVACDTGVVENACMKADYTVTFSAMKPAHVLSPGKEYCGEVVVSPIGISSETIDAQENCIRVTDDDYVRDLFLPRKANTHKGDYGKLLCICGSYGMAGAAALSVKAALRCGAGLVYTALPKSIYPIVAANAPEAVYFPLEDDTLLSDKEASFLKEKIASASAILIGCGLGTSAKAESMLKLCLSCAEVPVIIDADGINLLAQNIHVLQQTKAQVVLTPHPGEMARLTGLTVSEIQSNRLKAAQNFAAEHNTTIVLKGSGTVIVANTGEQFLNTNGNPGMAKGGSGDVLAGMISSFAAQGYSSIKSAVTAVFLHGKAGDACASQKSQIAMLAGDIVEMLPSVFLPFETA